MARRVPERYRLWALDHLSDYYYPVDGWQVEEVAQLFYELVLALKEQAKKEAPGPEEDRGPSCQS